MKIGIDLDSTLNNLDEAWAEWIQDTYDADFTVDKWTSWDVASLTSVGPKVYEFPDLPGTFANLRPRAGCQRVLKLLKEAGHRLYIPSACYVAPGREHVLADKLKWIEKHLPEVDMHDFISIQDKSLLRLDVLIDDGAHNFDGFTGQPILFDRPWNRDVNIRRAIGWDGVESALREMGAFDA